MTRRATIGTELSHEMISKIFDAVPDEVLAWQQRPLEALGEGRLARSRSRVFPQVS